MARSGKKKTAARSTSTSIPKDGSATKAAPANAPLTSALPARRDPRPWIYGGLDLVLVAMLVYMITKLVPNRLPSAAFHMWTLPIGMLVMAIGTFMRNAMGRKIALIAGSAVLFSVILMIARIIVSAAFLSGVYGAFGRAAAATALTGIALIVEIVGLLPIVQVKYLMSRAGKRAYGVKA